MATPGPVDPPYDPREDIAALEAELVEVLARIDNHKTRAVILLDHADVLRRQIAELDS
jgi:hypothetical protein